MIIECVISKDAMLVSKKYSIIDRIHSGEHTNEAAKNILDVTISIEYNTLSDSVVSADLTAMGK